MMDLQARAASRERSFPVAQSEKPPNGAGAMSPDSSSSDKSDVLDQVDVGEDREWLDVESDIEETMFQSLVDEAQFTDLMTMFAHVRETSSIDFPSICRNLGRSLASLVLLAR